MTIDLALRPCRGVFTLEKWYVDALLPDGSVVLVYLGRLRLFGVTMARVTAELLRPGQAPISGDAPARDIAGAGGRLRFGPASIEGELLTFRTPGLSGELRFAARHGPVALRTPFLEQHGRRLDWAVELPDADVTGTLRWPGGELAVSARGYRDRVYLDFSPWAFPLKTLVWGRAACGGHAATWIEADLGDQKLVDGWLDGRREPEARRQVELLDARDVLSGELLDLRGLHLGLARPLLRRLGNAAFVKRAGRATIAGEPGVSMSEVVTWA